MSISNFFCPKASQAANVSFTSVWNSWGGREKSLSTLPSLFFKTICFSIIVAPNAILATAAPMPLVWSDKPISHLSLSLNNSIDFKFELDGWDG